MRSASALFYWKYMTTSRQSLFTYCNTYLMQKQPVISVYMTSSLMTLFCLHRTPLKVVNAIQFWSFQQWACLRWMIRKWSVEHGWELHPKPKLLVTFQPYLSATFGPNISGFLDLCLKFTAQPKQIWIKLNGWWQILPQHQSIYLTVPESASI